MNRGKKNKSVNKKNAVKDAQSTRLCREAEHSVMGHLAWNARGFAPGWKSPSVASSRSPDARDRG